MANLLVVTSRAGAPMPPALGVVPHQTQVVSDLADALAHTTSADVAVIDGRLDLAWARGACQQLAASEDRLHILALLTSDGLGAITRDWGADDFVLDTASVTEWNARIGMGLVDPRHSGQIVGGEIVLDEAAYSATASGHPLNLTYTEFELLKFLMLHQGRVLTRDQLLSEVWGYGSFGGTRTVDVHIRRLRAKLGPEHDKHIGTVRNVGYRFIV